MFKLCILVLAVLFAVSMAAPEPKPQYFGGYPYSYGYNYPYASGYYGGYGYGGYLGY